MTTPSTSTELSGRVSPSRAPDGDILVPMRNRAWGVMLDYFEDLFLPAFNAGRAMYDIEPAPPRSGPPVTLEQAKAAATLYWEQEALRAEPTQTQAEAQAATTQPIPPQSPRRQRKPRQRSISHMVTQAEKTGKTVTSIITKPDSITINFSQEPSEANAPRDASIVAADRIIELRKRGR